MTTNAIMQIARAGLRAALRQGTTLVVPQLSDIDAASAAKGNSTNG